MPNPRFAAFVAPARPRAEVTRLVAGLLMALSVYLGIVILIFGSAAFWVPRDADLRWLEGLMDPSRPGPMLLILASFSGMALGPMLAARALHKRPAATLFGPAARTLRDFAAAAAIAGAVIGVALLLWRATNTPVQNLELRTWALLLPVSLLGVLLQTGAEEVLFRGYLQQQLAARFASPWVWAALPSLIFGLLHTDPVSAGSNAWLMAGAAAVFGLMAADLTARTGSIGAAWGFHFANNTMALLIVATDGTLTGLALWITPYDISDTARIRASLPLDLLMLGIIWFSIRRILGR